MRLRSKQDLTSLSDKEWVHYMCNVAGHTQDIPRLTSNALETTPLSTAGFFKMKTLVSKSCHDEVFTDKYSIQIIYWQKHFVVKVVKSMCVVCM